MEGSRDAPRYERRGRARRDARRRRGRRIAVVLASLLAVGFVFLLGLAVGLALDSAPEPGGTQTLVRTLAPGTVAPAPETVTVTSGAP